MINTNSRGHAQTTPAAREQKDYAKPRRSKGAAGDEARRLQVNSAGIPEHRHRADAHGKNRVAIYLSPNCERPSRKRLRRYFEEARSFGVRVVTVVQEEASGAAPRPTLKALQQRLSRGEFEAILGIGHDAFGSATPGVSRSVAGPVGPLSSTSGTIQQASCARIVGWPQGGLS